TLSRNVAMNRESRSGRSDRHMHRLSGFMRTYWTRGEPGRATPQSLVVFMHRMWLAALAFTLLGSSWDVSWHFKWLRDDLAAAHVLNTVGTGIAIGLVLAHSFTGYGTDRRSLRIMQIGTAIFVLAGPIDVINHRVNGLDLTAWSPSHLLLYGGTARMVAGGIRNWYHCVPTDRRAPPELVPLLPHGRAVSAAVAAGHDRAVGLHVREHVLPHRTAGVRDPGDR